MPCLRSFGDPLVGTGQNRVIWPYTLVLQVNADQSLYLETVQRKELGVERALHGDRAATWVLRRTLRGFPTKLQPTA